MEHGEQTLPTNDLFVNLPVQILPSLREVLLPTTLHTIRVKAFMNCAALVELAIPPSPRYIGSRGLSWIALSLEGLPRCQEGINGEESMLKRMLSPTLKVTPESEVSSRRHSMTGSFSMGVLLMDELSSSLCPEDRC